MSSKQVYRLGARLGGGGMAEVFRAVHVGADGREEAVAIKRLLPQFSEDEAMVAMLRAEARIASLLDHPNIVRVLDFDRDEDGQFFLAMELVEGSSLDAVLRTGRMDRSRAVAVTAEVLRALAYAHAFTDRGQPLFIVHRDVSPENILCANDGRVKLADFGIAKAAVNTRLTRTGLIKGKAAYLSPEQARAGDLDQRSDLFSLGVVLHELLTGTKLFVAEHVPEMIDRVLNLPIPSPRAAVPELSVELERVCLRLLSRDREARFQSASDALAALLACPESALSLAEQPAPRIRPVTSGSAWKTSLGWALIGAGTAILALLAYQC